MSDEPREDEEGPDESPAADGSEEAPPPATWAGRARAAGEQTGAGAEPEAAGEAPEDEAPGDDATGADAGARPGMTQELERLEAELSAELDDLGTDERADAGEPHDADEQEEPPDEFQFGGDEGDEAGDAAAEPEEPDHETAESDTLARADLEAQQEAAHAGLRARAEHAASGRDTGLGSAVASVAAAPARGAGDPPKRNVWWRFVAASFVIVASVAAATAVSFLLFLSDIGDALGDEDFSQSVAPSLEEVKGGEPQTILILGSDKRTTTPGDPGRSDTTMLLRVDPEKEFLALLSLPRDLEVEIPGYGTDKLNAAYSLGEQFDPAPKGGGGPQLTLRTVKDLLGIDINHIVNVDFQGFYDAINAIGCVYIDVDRHYFNPEGGDYDDIDIQAGYTKLCGFRALDYVRFRHTDNDLVRGARQQLFIREARQQIPPRDLLPPPFGNAELIDIFTKHTTSDINSAPTIIEMLRSFVSVRNASVRQVSLGSLTLDGEVAASKEEIEDALDQFLGTDLPAAAPDEPAGPRKGKGKRRKSQDDSGPAMVDAAGTAQQYAGQFEGFLRGKKAKLPVFYPTMIVANSNAAITPESRAHVIEPPDGQRKPFHGFKYVMTYQEEFGTSYYGLAGVDWVDPPILNNPSETREIDGREYMLFYERDRLRLVGWKTDKGAYWVSNTLTRVLSEAEMLAVATSARELDG